MHCHYFLFLAFILITIKKTLAQESNIFGDPNTPFDVSLTQNVADGGVFDVPVNGIYDNLDGTDSASTNSIFDTASDNSFDLLLGDNPDGCTSLQTFGRIRARGNDFCNSNDPAFRPPMVDFKDYLNPIPKDLTTQKELDDLFCPTEVFAGYLNVPCCNIFRELETTPVDTTSLDLPLYVTQHGLFNIEHAFLLTSANYLTCVPEAAWCCFQYLPRFEEGSSEPLYAGRGYWCARYITYAKKSSSSPSAPPSGN